jgi:hypothetical protein
VEIAREPGRAVLVIDVSSVARQTVMPMARNALPRCPAGSPSRGAADWKVSCSGRVFVNLVACVTHRC